MKQCDRDQIDFEIVTDTFTYDEGTLHFDEKWRNILDWIKDKVKLNAIINEIGNDNLLDAIGIHECMDYFDLFEEEET